MKVISSLDTGFLNKSGFKSSKDIKSPALNKIEVFKYDDLILFNNSGTYFISPLTLNTYAGDCHQE